MASPVAPAIVATVRGRKRCRYVAAGEQCRLPMYGHVGPHRFARDERAEAAADLRARLAEAAERDGPGSFFADLLADHDAREGRS